MSRVNVIVASRTEQENFILQKKLDPIRQDFRGIGVIGVHPMGLSVSVDRNTGLVILNLANWVDRDGSIIRELWHTGYRGPILVLIKTDITLVSRELKMQDNLIFMRKPVDQKVLTAVLTKMLMARKVKQQNYPRYPTAQKADFEFSDRASKAQLAVKNLSRGGAFVELNSAVPIRVGETVRMKLELKDLNRTYTIAAKVVWLNAPRGERTTGGMGVQFIQSDMKKVIIGC